MLLAYFVEESVAKGDLAWDQVLEIDDKYITYSRDMSVSNIPLKKGVNYTLTDMLNAAMVPSSNSAAAYLAELIAGDVASYNKLANEKLASWGIKDVDWVSASGLPAGALGPFETHTHPENSVTKLTAREVGVIATRLVKDYPHILEITSQSSVKFPRSGDAGETLTNTNQLLTDSDYKVSGLKTGSLPEYGRSLVTKTEIHGVPVISVVLGVDFNDKAGVFTTSKDMWNQATEQLAVKKLGKGDVFGTVPVKIAKSGEIETAFNQNLTYLGAKDEGKVQVKQVHLNTEVPAKAGDVIGQAAYTFPGDHDVLLPELTTFNVQTNDDVTKANWIIQSWRNMFG